MRITLKLATSLDGRIATCTGESKWITSPDSRAIVHELRGQHDGVLVGIGTLLADDPLLSVRTKTPPRCQPHRIILDTHLRTPEDAAVFSVETGRVIILCGAQADEGRKAILEGKGATILPCDLDEGGRISPSGAIERLTAAGLSSVFVEGGGQIAGAFLKANCVDRLEWFRAPMVIGGDGLPALGELGIEALTDAIRFRREGVRIVGPDVWETYEKER